MLQNNEFMTKPHRRRKKGRGQERNEVRWRPGQEARLDPRVFGSKCTVYWRSRKYLWHCWNFSAPGYLCLPLLSPRYAPGRGVPCPLWILEFCVFV